jgi:hypothetical protein
VPKLNIPAGDLKTLCMHADGPRGSLHGTRIRSDVRVFAGIILIQDILAVPEECYLLCVWVSASLALAFGGEQSETHKVATKGCAERRPVPRVMHFMFRRLVFLWTGSIAVARIGTDQICYT